MNSPWRAALVLLALLIPATTRAVDWIDLSGYIKSFAVGIHPAQFTNPEAAPEQNFIWANNNRARTNLAIHAAEWLGFDASYDLSLRIQDDDLFTGNPFLFMQAASIYRIDDLNPLLWPDDPGKGDHVALLQNLDRLYATVSTPRFDLYVGRQAIAWGSAKAINPTDIIAPFLYTEIDTEDRIGIDAIRLRVPAGALAELDLGYVAGEDFEWKESAAFARGKFYALETDFSLIAMMFRQNAFAGADVTRSIGGAGGWVEAAYVWADASGDGDSTVTRESKDYLRLSAGADYNFGAGVYLFLEYHFNGAGAADPRDYTRNIISNPTAYVDGAVYFFGRQYLIPGLTWQATPLASFAAQVLANLGDGSFLVAPYVEYNATDNLYLSAGGYLPVGDDPTAVPFPGNGGDPDNVIPLFNSEFGAYPAQYYAFLRYYF
jgi:hypothetical protein